jgi:hypothetical protein
MNDGERPVLDFEQREDNRDTKTTVIFCMRTFILETSVEWDLECIDFYFRQGAMRRNNALLQRIAT